jgi:hypothetical protein
MQYYTVAIAAISTWLEQSSKVYPHTQELLSSGVSLDTIALLADTFERNLYLPCTLNLQKDHGRLRSNVCILHIIIFERHSTLFFKSTPLTKESSIPLP